MLTKAAASTTNKRGDNPKLFAEPASLSFGYLNVDGHNARKPLLLSLSDAGTGGGAWNVSIEPQTASPGAPRSRRAPPR